MHKKLFRHPKASVVITVLLAILIMGLAGSTSIASAAGFSDVPSSSPYYTAINNLAGKGIIGGYANGTFGPNNPVTRQQFAKMIILSLGVSPQSASDNPFWDVASGWPYPSGYVAAAALNDITNGTDSHHFAPLANITRSQVVTMVERAGGSGKTPAGYASSGNATRGEVAWMLYTLRNESRVQLKVSGASSLKAAFTEIGAAFDKSHHSGTTLNFDASGTLQKQIEAGAPVDVFASAALTQVNALLNKGLAVQNSVRYFASNEICLVVPANSTLGLTSFTDLTKASVRKVGYGDPAIAPHGVAAEEILHTLGIFSQVKPKVIYAANVSAALQYVTSGEVDAGIIFTTEAYTAGSKVKIVAVSKPAWHNTITYPIAAITASAHQALGTAFCDYVKGPYGQEILHKYGFLKYVYTG
jgi:molybdate transport system substrate-binding protein